MADTVDEVYVWDGTSWVPVVRDDCELPISSADDTVTLDSPSANTFAISTGENQALYVTRTSSDADQLVIGENPPGFQGGAGSSGLHIQGIASAEIKSTLNSTGHGAAAGGVVSYQNTGWSIRDRQSGGGIVLTINPSGDAGTSTLNALGISGVDGQVRFACDGSSSVPGMTYYNDLDTGFSRSADDEVSIVTGGTSSLITGRNGVTIPDELFTPRIVGSQAPANDAAIDLGANLTVSTGGNERLEIDSAGRLKLLDQPQGQPGKNYTATIYTEAISATDHDLILSGQFFGPPYFKDMVRITSTYDLIVKYGDVKTSNVSGLAANDAAIELGAHAKITAGVAYYQIINNGYHIFQSDGSQSRLTNEGDFLVGTQTAFAGEDALPATKTVVLATGKKGIARWSAHERLLLRQLTFIFLATTTQAKLYSSPTTK